VTLSTLDDLEPADVTAVLLKSFDRPGTEDSVEVATRDAVLAFENRAVLGRIKQPERAFVDR